MKRVFISGLLICTIAVVSVLAQNETEPYDSELINQNNVKAQTTYDYDYINGKPAKKGTRSLSIKFDSKGNKIEEIGYKGKGEVYYVQTYAYDAKSRMTEYCKYKGNRKTLEYKMVVKYDNNGNKLLETGFNGSENFKNVYSYGNDGRIAQTVYYVGSRIDERRNHIHKGNITEVTVQSGNGVQLYLLKDYYDNKHNLIKEEQVENNHTVSRRMEYDYDSKGNQTSEAKYMNNKLVYRIDRTFDSKGKLLEVNQENSGSPRFLANKYKYDSAGRIAEELFRSDTSKEFSKNIYKYQDNGLPEAVDSYFASYKYQVLYIYAYETY